MKSQSSVVLAHISDVHLTRLKGFGPEFWSMKRGLGFLNWHLRRKNVYCRVALDKVVSDIHAQGIDHIIVGGDLVNIGLPGEYEDALQWLKSVGETRDVCVVPGNHDIYVSMSEGEGVERWRAYMVGDDDGRSSSSAGDVQFPFVRRVGCVAIIGVNTAVPTPPFVAAGRIGNDQLLRLKNALNLLGRQGFVRVVVLHHPPLPHVDAERRSLADAEDLVQVIQEEGADLLLHGHLHKDTFCLMADNERKIPVVGVAPGSARREHGHEPLARYNLVKIDRETESTKIEIETRGLLQPDGDVGHISKRVI